jgi:glycerate-2-kinase
MRITNGKTLCRHGNKAGRRLMVQILEAGLQETDPYDDIIKLIKVDNQRLILDNPIFVPQDSSVTGPEIIEFENINRIFVIGAGKGVQRAAKAIEDILGDRLTGGHIIDKKGCDVILDKVGVTLGGHPVPDEDCVRGCQRILALTMDLGQNDLVFTVGASGFSSLLTLPAPGISLDDVIRTVKLLQIERGMPTSALSPIRNHIDLLKGGRISAHIHPARTIHLIAKDPATYESWIYHNTWVHTLPDYSTFSDAVRILHEWDAWNDIPESVRCHLLKGDPELETVKPKTYIKYNFRIYGILPGVQGVWPSAHKKAIDLGLQAVTLVTQLNTEARYAGQVVGTIARTIEREGKPFKPPIALFTSGELLVTVGTAKGIGGRNQEFILAAALQIAGSENIVIGAVDTEGTDGPGAQFNPTLQHIPTLAGGIVDGYTITSANAKGININQVLEQHNATPNLLALDSGILATQSTGLRDLGVVLIM